MSRGDTPQPPPHSDAFVFAIAALLAAMAVSAWSGLELAGWSATGRWPPAPAGSALGDLLRLAGLNRHGSGQPATVPEGTWRVWSSLVFGCTVTLAALVWWWVRRWRSTAPAGGRTGRYRPTNSAGRRGERWANPTDLRSLKVRRSDGRRLILGRWRRRTLATEYRHSVLVFGPTQSGKTSGLAIPALLEWDGPIVATSVKGDLASATMRWRAAKGPCAVFDPTNGSGLGPLSRWSPLPSCGSWSSAQKMASWLVECTPGRSGLSDAAFWYTSAAKQLAPLLLAAELAGYRMTDVVRWTNASDFDEPGEALRLFGETAAAEALAACAGRDDRIRSSVTTTLESVLTPFEDPAVAVSTAASDIDVRQMLTSSGTLYLCGPSHEQERVQGLFAALVSTVVAEAVSLTASLDGPLDPPLLLVLDEAANIAPVRDLDTIASTAAGLGIQLVTVCQDLSQLARRYDPARARTIVNNHRAKLVLSGISDVETLDLISGLAGEQAVREESASQDLRDGRRTRSTSTTMRRLAPASELRRTPPGQAVLIYGHLPPVRLALRPWYLDRRLRRKAAAGGAGGAGGTGGAGRLGDPGGVAGSRVASGRREGHSEAPLDGERDRPG